jgi:hypothetical protein
MTRGRIAPATGGHEPALVEGPRGQILSVPIEHIERNVDRRSGHDLGIAAAEQLKTRSELLVEDGHLAVEHKCPHGQRGDCGGDVTESPRMVHTVAAE